MNFRVVSLLKVVLLILSGLASGCSTEHYHLNMLSHSRTSAHQQAHILALQDIAARRQSGGDWNLPQGGCPAFSPGYGGFTVSCPQR